MSDDLGYLNARVRALQGLLISGSGYGHALETGSLPEFVSFLESTSYAAAIGEAMTVTKGISGVEEGLRRDFQRTIDHVVKIAGGRPRRLLTIVLGRWELFNIKTVLRGLHARAGLDAIMGSTVPFGRLDEVGLKELARQGDVRAAIDLLAQWHIPAAADLRRAYPTYRDRGDFQVLETSLDRAFFAAGLRALDAGRADDAIVAGHIRREIDVILLGYALRAMHHGADAADAAEVFISGGQVVTRPVFERLCAAASLADFLGAMPHSSFAACLEEFSRSAQDVKRLLALDHALQSCFVRQTIRLVLRDPLSIAFTIGYLWRKMAEIVNLRLIARGKCAQLPREQIEPLMVATG